MSLYSQIPTHPHNVSSKSYTDQDYNEHDTMLNTSEEDLSFEKENCNPSPTAPFYKRHFKTILTHLLLLSGNLLIISFVNWRVFQRNCYGVYGPDLVYSITRSSFTPAPLSQHVFVHSIYLGRHSG
jgi:hypothetical protein